MAKIAIFTRLRRQEVKAGLPRAGRRKPERDPRAGWCHVPAEGMQLPRTARGAATGEGRISPGVPEVLSGQRSCEEQDKHPKGRARRKLKARFRKRQRREEQLHEWADVWDF